MLIVSDRTQICETSNRKKWYQAKPIKREKN